MGSCSNASRPCLRSSHDCRDFRPSAMAAMAVASEPRETDVVLDPMCGTGTLLYERASLAGFSYLLGADIDLEAVNHAKANLERFAGSA
jgi:tRNA (guanine6-N2)-methyltransferase